MDCTVPGFTKSRIQLRDFHFHFGGTETLEPANKANFEESDEPGEFCGRERSPRQPSWIEATTDIFTTLLDVETSSP